MLPGCLQIGDVFSYRMARNRTSQVIKNTNVRLEVVDLDDVDTNFSLAVYIEPIFGEPNNIERELDVARNLTDLDNLQRLRDGEVLDSPSARIKHEGTTSGGCDKIQVDKIPDTEDTKDMVVHLVLCGVDTSAPVVPGFDVELTARGQRINLGYDKVEGG